MNVKLQYPLALKLQYPLAYSPYVFMQWCMLLSMGGMEQCVSHFAFYRYNNW